jgi:RNA polymerase sigma factor FliA
MSGIDPARQQLIYEGQGLVRSLAWSIHRKCPPHVEIDDLVGYGNVGLAEAARDFDSARGVRFVTFAHYRIRGAIYDGLSKMSWFSRAQYNHLRYEQMTNDLLRLEGEAGDAQRTPAYRLEDEVRWLKDVSTSLAVVYLATQRDSDGENRQSELEDRSAQTPDGVAIEREMSEKLHELIDSLPEEAGRLIRAAYFEGLTLTEAGQRLGVSKAWASRLHAKTLERLARSLRTIGAAD